MAASRTSTILFVHSARPVRERAGRFFLSHPTLRLIAQSRLPSDYRDAGYALLVLPAARAVELAAGQQPVIGYGAPGQLTACLKAGCADFLRDTWSFEELEARAARVLGVAPQRIGPCLLAGRELTGPRAVIVLTGTQARIMSALAARPGTVLTREAVGAIIEGRAGRDSRMLDVYVSQIRSGLARIGCAATVRILSVRGVGYRMELVPVD